MRIRRSRVRLTQLGMKLPKSSYEVTDELSLHLAEG